MALTIEPTYLSENEFDKRFTLMEFEHGDKFCSEEEIKLALELSHKYPNRIWSCIEGDSDDSLFYENRFAVVNFMYYVFTNEPYGDNESISVELDMDFD